MQASNRRTEIEGIAREIHSLIRQGRFRLRDIAVIARNVEDYKDTIKEVFKRNTASYRQFPLMISSVERISSMSG